MTESEKHHDFLLPIAGIGLLAVAFGAFGRPVRRKIKERDGNKSVWSGKTTQLEVAHISHNRNKTNYNHESNGRTLTTAEHMWDHINRHGTEQLGLTDSQNDWAIWQLWKRFWGIKG